MYLKYGDKNKVISRLIDVSYIYIIFFLIFLFLIDSNVLCTPYNLSPELVLVEFSDVSLTEAFLALVIPMQPPILHNRNK